LLVFTARCSICTIVQSAVLRLLVVCPSVRPSVCDVCGSGSHRLEVLETNYTDNKPNIFALRSPKAIHLLPGEHGEILRRLAVGWGKVVCWSTKVTISLKRVKIEEKLVWMAYSNALSNGTISDHYGLFFPKIGGSQPPPNTPIAIISGTGKATNFKIL